MNNATEINLTIANADARLEILRERYRAALVRMSKLPIRYRLTKAQHKDLLASEDEAWAAFRTMSQHDRAAWLDLFGLGSCVFEGRIQRAAHMLGHLLEDEEIREELVADMAWPVDNAY